MVDNECSRAVKEYVTSEETDMQFVESYKHRVNTAKHGYKAATYHTIATLCTTDPAHPIQSWDQFMPQLQATLNIMQTSQINSNKLTYEALNRRRFDWNQTPLAPVGQRALTLLDPANRLTCTPHANDAYTLGFAPDNYRLLHFWIKVIGGSLITGTYMLYTAYYKLLSISEGDCTVAAAAELLEIFKMIIPNGTKETVQHCTTIDKLTNMLLEY